MTHVYTGGVESSHGVHQLEKFTRRFWVICFGKVMMCENNFHKMDCKKLIVWKHCTVTQSGKLWRGWVVFIAPSVLFRVKTLSEMGQVSSPKWLFPSLIPSRRSPKNTITIEINNIHCTCAWKLLLPSRWQLVCWGTCKSPRLLSVSYAKHTISMTIFFSCYSWRRGVSTWPAHDPSQLTYGRVPRIPIAQPCWSW